MTAHTPTAARESARVSPLRVALSLAAASVVAILLNAVVAAVAVRAGADPGFGPLTLPAYASFTIIGIVVGWFGWRLVERRAANPRRVLVMLVPIVLVLSFIPDVLLLTLQFIPGTTVGAVVALMVMHVIVVAVAVPAYLIAGARSRPRSL